MVMDADQSSSPNFCRRHYITVEADPDLMTVGGVFYGERGSGLIEQLQRNETSGTHARSPAAGARYSC